MFCPKCNALAAANTNRCARCFASLAGGTSATPRPAAAVNLHAVASGLLVPVQVGLILGGKAQADAHRDDDATPFLLAFLALTAINFGYSAYARFARQELRGRWVATMVFSLHCLLASWVVMVVVYRIKRGF